MPGIFRRYRYRAPLPRRIVGAPPAPVVPGEIPRKPIHVAILLGLVVRKILHERQTRTAPLLGVRQPGRVPVARILMERHRRIMFERLARRIPVASVAPPVVVGATPILLRRPTVRRPVHPRLIARPIVSGAAVVGVVVVCTDGVWTPSISFLACDDFRITIDGPAADQVKISTTIELEE